MVVEGGFENGYYVTVRVLVCETANVVPQS